MSKEQFPIIFQQLKQCLQVYQQHLDIKSDSSESYTLYITYSPTYNKELLFGAVQIQKPYVSFHFMPMSMYPNLLENISLELKKRLRSKSCFIFTEVNQVLFTELEQLTQAGFEALIDNGELRIEN